MFSRSNPVSLAQLHSSESSGSSYTVVKEPLQKQKPGDYSNSDLGSQHKSTKKGDAFNSNRPMQRPAGRPATEDSVAGFISQ
jgi:hypothetical protein